MGISYAQLRDIDTSKLTTSADAAILIGKDVESRAGEIVDLVKNNTGAGFWGGIDAEKQAELLGSLPPPLQAAGSVFKAAAGTVDTLVAELKAAKAQIDTALSSYPLHKVADDAKVTWPPSPNAAVEEMLRQQAEKLFDLLMQAVQKADLADQTAATQLAQNDVGSGPVGVKLPDGSTYLATGDKDNVVKVSNDSDGNLIATVDGKELKFDPGTRLTVDGQDGKDKIEVDRNVKEDVTVLGGDDDDTILGSDKANVLNGGEGNDTIDGRGGDDTIVGGDGENTLRGGDGADTILGGDDADEIHGGDGNDRIYTGGNQENNKYVKDFDVVYGNDGDDIIDGAAGEDRIAGGAGNDTISGGAGNDYLDGQKGDDTIKGGAGNDTIYGLDGKDRLYGDDGRDYLEGGKDSDFIYGGADNDVISGGRDDDYLYGQGGDDNIYAGDGSDVVDGGDGIDQAFTQPEDVVTEATENVADTKIVDTGFINVEGTEDFQARTRADLDMYGASPTGQQMIEALQAQVEKSGDPWSASPGDMMPGEDTITIEEYAAENGTAKKYPYELGPLDLNPDFANDNPKIQSNPAFHLDTPGQEDGKPSIVLYHELAHTYDNMVNGGTDDDRHEQPGVNDTKVYDGENTFEGVPKGERNAVGLPIDHDDNPSPDSPMQRPDNHPWELTENALRAEMGLPLRPRYGSDIPPGTPVN